MSQDVAKFLSTYSDADISRAMNADRRLSRIRQIRQSVRSKYPGLPSVPSNPMFTAFAECCPTRGERVDGFLARLESKEQIRMGQVIDKMHEAIQ